MAGTAPPASRAGRRRMRRLAHADAGAAEQAQHLKVPMRIREEGREERSAPVLVAVSIESDVQSSVPRNLMCFQVSPRCPLG
jgi:hypothetical protein